MTLLKLEPLIFIEFYTIPPICGRIWERHSKELFFVKLLQAFTFTDQGFRPYVVHASSNFGGTGGTCIKTASGSPITCDVPSGVVSC